MSRVVRAVVGVGLAIVGAVTGNFQLVLVGASLFAGAVFGPKGVKRAAVAAQLQIGEQPRQAIFGRAAVDGSLVDAFNYGGKNGTDWEVLVIALADHRCDALEGFFVDDTYHAFAADGNVAGFNSQLQVFWRSGTWDQTVPSILTTNGPGWTANDRGRGVAYVVVAYKADKSDAKNPVWPRGRPRFRWVVRGLRCYQPRKDSTVGGSGAHRRDNPATWEWTENPIDIRHNWARGIYAGDRVAEPGMLLIGRGLSAIEAPPQNVFARANLCDEIVGGQARYRIGGLVASTEPFIDVESDIAAACAGVISQPQGAVEVDPGQAKAPVATFTDADLIVGSTVRFSEFLGQGDNEWVNSVVATFVDPAQRWTERSAPVRRDLADVVADGAPREARLPLQLVTGGAQAQRVAEVARRFGRLWGRAQVTLPPRFSFIEEGDWVSWQSDRYLGGATFTFRVDGWGSEANWHHQLTLRQISASVFSDTAPLDDGSVAADQDAPLAPLPPAVGAWAVAPVLIESGGLSIPALRVTGATDDPAAQFVVFEYVQQTAAPDAGTIWTFAANTRPDVTLLDIPVLTDGDFWVSVSYVISGVLTDRRVIGPATADPAVGGGGGLNSATIQIYQRAASAPALPSVTSTYTYATGLLSVLNNGWTQGIPPDNGQPCWTATVFKSGTAATATVLPGDYSTVRQFVVSGTPGVSSGEFTIYRRSATDPGTPSGGSITFSTGALAIPAGASSSIPAGTDPVYASRGYAQTTTPSVAAPITWGPYVRVFQDGESVDVIYRRSATQPATPSPSGGVPSGWFGDIASVPAGPDPIFASFGSRSAPGVNWTWDVPVRAQGVDGGPGANARTVTVISDRQTIAYDAAGLPTPTTQTTTFTTNKQNTTGIVVWSITDANGAPRTPVTSFLSAGTGDTVTMTEAQFNAARNGTSGVIVTGTITDGTTFFDRISVVRVQEGQTGAAGATTGVIALYRRAAESPAPARPTSSLIVYTPATNSATNTDFWSTTQPAANGFPLWAIFLPYSTTSATVTVAGASFSTPAIINRDGVSATTGLLTNEVHNVAAASNGLGYSLANAGGTFEVFFGGQNVRLSSTFSIVGGATKNGLTMSLAANGVYTLSGASWTSDTETFTLRAVYQGVTLDQIYTITKARAGGNGADAKLISLSATRQQIRFNSAGTLDPASQDTVFTVTRQNTVVAAVWTIFDLAGNAASAALLTGSGDTRTLTAANFNTARGSTQGVRVVATVTDGSALTDQITVIRVADGVDANQVRIATNQLTFPFIAHTGEPIAQTATLTANLTAISGTVTWGLRQQNGTTVALNAAYISTSGNTATITHTQFAAFIAAFGGTTMRVSATLAGFTDEVVLTRVADATSNPAGGSFVRTRNGDASTGGWIGAAASTTVPPAITRAGARSLQLSTNAYERPRISTPIRQGDRFRLRYRIRTIGSGTGPGNIFFALYNDTGTALTNNLQFDNLPIHAPNTLDWTYVDQVITYNAAAELIDWCPGFDSINATLGNILVIDFDMDFVPVGSLAQINPTEGTKLTGIEAGADVTGTAQRTIEPQFPVIEIKHGEAGHTGSRTVTHVAKRGTTTITGGTWSLPIVNLGAGSATINSSTGTVTLSGIVQSGAYSIRYTHTDGIVTDFPVNVTYVPAAAGGVVSAKTQRTTSSSGQNSSSWTAVIVQTITSAPAGRIFFNTFNVANGSGLQVLTGTGTCEHEARLVINGTVVRTLATQPTITGGVLEFSNFSSLFDDAYSVPSGTVTVQVELRRTSGTGQITSMSNVLDTTILAS